jgi:hypothetical protein
MTDRGTWSRLRRRVATSEHGASSGQREDRCGASLLPCGRGAGGRVGTQPVRRRRLRCASWYPMPFIRHRPSLTPALSQPGEGGALNFAIAHPVSPPPPLTPPHRGRGAAPRPASGPAPRSPGSCGSRELPLERPFQPFQPFQRRSNGAFQGAPLERFITVPRPIDQISSFVLMAAGAYPD